MRKNNSRDCGHKCGKKRVPVTLEGGQWGFRENGVRVWCVREETCILFELMFFCCVFFHIQRYQLSDARNRVEPPEV